MNKIFRFVANSALLWLSALHAEAPQLPVPDGETAPPAVVWFSTPVRPGEIVMVHGGNWSMDALVAVEAMGNGETGKPALGATPEITSRVEVLPLSIRRNCISFHFPRNLEPGAVRCRIVDAGRTSKPFVLNEPDLWWFQGDGGQQASPGGWLGVFGRCLSSDGNARLALKRGNKTTPVALESQDQWSLRAGLPDGLAEGDYEVLVHNGFAGESGWRSPGNVQIRPRHEVWKDRVFDVTDFGAVPNDRAFDTSSVQAALRAAAKNGGGIILFPRGRYQITEALTVPPYTLLKGKGLKLSQLYWPDTEAPPDSLIQGSHSFGIEDLFITSGNYLSGIVAKPSDGAESGNITLRRVRIRLLRDQYVSAEERVRREGLPGAALRIGGPLMRIEDCDVYVTGTAFGLGGTDAVIARNRFMGGTGYLSGGERIIFEKNFITGGGISVGPGGLYQRNVYWANNRVERNFKHDREAMTFDGGGHAYQGGLKSWKGTRMVLATERMAWRHGSDHWVNGGMMVMDGRGAGQLRRITRIGNNVVEIDQPWTIEPDVSSRVMISCFRERYLFANNHIEDATIALQLYGSLIEGILSGNTCARAGGFHSYGMFKGGGPEPSWYVQFLGNEILEGNAYRGAQNEIPASDSHLAIRDRGHPSARFPFTRTCLARRNILHNNARLEVLGGGIVDNALIENCVVKNSDVGLYVTDRARGVILWGNRFENVRKPMAGAIGKAVLHPADHALAAMSGAATLLDSEMPQEWQKLRQSLETSRAADPETDVTKKSVQEAKAKMLQLVAKANRSTIPADVMSWLLGMTATAHTHTLNPVINAGKGGDAKMLITFSLAPWSAPCTVKARPVPPAGWKIRAESGASLRPGGSARQFLFFNLPEGNAGAFHLPLTYEVAGAGWRFEFSDSISLGSFAITDWLLAGPFENKSGKSIDTTVHPPERKLDVTAIYRTRDGQQGWKPVHTDRGWLDLVKQFKDSGKSVAYAVACVRSDRAIPVKFSFSGDGALLYVNGKRIGTRWRFSQWGCTTLQRGENLIQLISTNIDGGWRVQTKVETLGALKPGELYCVAAEALKDVNLLKNASRPTPEGKGLPHCAGIDWKLTFDDDFNRDRLGNVLEGRSDAHWISREWKIVDGHVQPQAAWTTLAYGEPIKPPVRIEYDVYSNTDKVRILGTMLCPKGMSKHRFWGQMYGNGYFLSLGWHNRFSNGVMRNEKEAIIDESGIRLAKDKWYHVIAQFIPPRCQLFVEGKKVLEYEDRDWIAGLNEVALYSYPIHRFDNLRIYQDGKQ